MSKVNFNQHYYVFYFIFILYVNLVNSTICPTHNHEFLLMTNTCSIRTYISQGIISHYTVDNNFDGRTILVKLMSYHHSLYDDNSKYDHQDFTIGIRKPLNESQNGVNQILYTNVTEFKVININDITFYDVLSVYWIYAKKITYNVTSTILEFSTVTSKSIFYSIMNGIYFVILTILGFLRLCIEFLIINFIKIFTISFKFIRDYFTNLYYKAVDDL